MGYRKADIISAVSIEKVAELLSIELEPISTGNFTARCRCPGINHKHGSERTPSLYIDTINNNYYCYGCGSSHNQIDFYILATGCSFLEALDALGPLIDPSKVGLHQDSKKTNFSVLMEISKYIRGIILKNRDDMEWIMKLQKNIDNSISKIDRFDTKRSEMLLKKVKRVCVERYDLK